MDASVPDGSAHEGSAGPSGSSQAKSNVRGIRWLVGMGLQYGPCCSQSLAEKPGFQANAPMIWAQPPINYTPCGWGSVR